MHNWRAPRRAVRRAAVAVRSDQHHYHTEGTNEPQDFYGEPWYIDAPGRAEPVAAREDRDGDPG